jgi:hypothetical protein
MQVVPCNYTIWLPTYRIAALAFPTGNPRLVAVEWYDGGGGPHAAGAPVLALALENGRLQLMAHEADDGGVCVDTGMRVRGAKWSSDGMVGARRARLRRCCGYVRGPVLPPRGVARLATRVPALIKSQPFVWWLLFQMHTLLVIESSAAIVVARQALAVWGMQLVASGPDAGREPWLLQLYSPSGEHLRTLRVPAPPGGGGGAGGGGGGISGATWEGGGLRVALAVEASVLFASVRRDHLWGYFGSTLAYTFVRPDRPQEHCVVFWDTRSNSRWGAGSWGGGRGRLVGRHGCTCLCAAGTGLRWCSLKVRALKIVLWSDGGPRCWCWHQQCTLLHGYALRRRYIIIATPHQPSPQGTPNLCAAWWACAPRATLPCWRHEATRRGSTC